LKKHTKIYCDYFGIKEPTEYRPCEWCESRPLVDINHIIPRGMGGKNPAVDTIENLVGMCRACHVNFENKQISKTELSKKHLTNL